MPAQISAYINSQHYSLFPLFPWLAFMLFGGYFASRYVDARENKKEKEFILRLGIGGAILFVASAIGMKFQDSMYITSISIRANPLFFFERLGIVMMLLTACWFYADYRKTEKSFVLDVGRESLMVYTAHLLIIYGRFWNDRSPAFYFGGTFDLIKCIISTIVLIIIMIGTAIAWGWMKRNHLPLARVMFFMFMVTMIGIFLTN